ncbi:hypothetical protein BDZ94DRAFT_1304460 [Collybia nuda]|uniref:WD40 repeat-like protein n=1 Tax=Collybia nuda TaxID=64659 RepID=A0A9P5YEW6_9AGAR|nr:hypothetical protein BDZ94DRAFT_1304460 [Collybia nuda]
MDAVFEVEGVLVGSHDGTLYAFNQSRPTIAVGQRSQLYPSRPTSPIRISRNSRGPSRSSTPSITSPSPFNVTPRSRIVSGVTTERVEAPKNYVDFEDEPEKLKEMLKGRNPRDKLTTSEPDQNRPTPTDKSPASSLLGPPHSSLKRKSIPKPLISSAQSPSTANSISSASSPPDQVFPGTAHDLSLWCHILPPRSGPGRAVTKVQFLDTTNEYFAALQETGDISIFSLKDGSCLATAHADDIPFQPPSGIKVKDISHDVWLWSYLEIFHIGESTILFVSAAIDPSSPSPATMDIEDNGVLEKSRLAVFEFHANEDLAPLEVRLVKIGSWSFDGSAHSVGLHQEPDSTTTFYLINSAGHFVTRKFKLLPRVPVQMEVRAPDSHLANLSSLPLPNPFKAIKPRSVDHLPLGERANEPGRVSLEEEADLGELIGHGPLSGFRPRTISGRMFAILWNSEELTLFQYQESAFRILYVDPVPNIVDVAWIDDSSYNVLFKEQAVHYAIKLVNSDDNESTAEPGDLDSRNVKSEISKTVSLGQCDAVDIGPMSKILATSLDSSGSRRIVCYDVAGPSEKPRTLWQTSSKRPVINANNVTSLLPLEIDVIIEGYGDGRIRQSSFLELCGKVLNTSTINKVSEPALNGYITGLHVVQNARTKETFIVGGADDGSVAFWTIDHFKLCARWIIFITPLASVIQIQEAQEGPLRGCVLCVSVDGTVAVIAVDGFQFLYLIPGSAAPLCRVCLGGHNLLLIYADHRARLWDVQTKEFWRSMNLDKVDELLEQGGWTDLSLSTQACLPNTALKPVPGSSRGMDVVSTLTLDLARFTSEAIAIAKMISTNRDQTRKILLTLEKLRYLLSALLTPGLNEDIDVICSDRLHIQNSTASVGFASCGAVTLYNGSRPQDPWCISGDVSAARALSITVVLSALSLFEEHMEGANTVTIFYATSLASSVGPWYQPPSLVFLAQRWFDGSNEVRQAARTLFDYAVACLTDEEANAIAEQWQHHLPCLQPTANRECMHAALALFLCGYLASEKYSLLSANALTDISKSIALYLHDEQSLHRVLAVDLCSRGFHIWQHYIDAMEILRALFILATTTRKENISTQNVGTQARLAVLQISTTNTALFMTTLGLDILTPPSLEHRRTVLQIVAFLIRKRPIVLQPNIPKLMEAVVKSLDPNVTTHREAVLDTATEIIGYVVNTFPSVDFHMGTQRLAVGSIEGAVVMYDLKTAIRLYVLDGHKKGITACSFSPDGRRLLTLSLEESVVRVWKVGSSFVSFFNPGAPPRQGHGGSEPFKTISFNVGDEANMGVAATLEWVKFEWVADRSVKLKIRESILTFST